MNVKWPFADIERKFAKMKKTYCNCKVCGSVEAIVRDGIYWKMTNYGLFSGEKTIESLL